MIANLTLLDLYVMPPSACVTSAFTMELDGVPMQFGLVPAHVGCLLRTPLAPERIYRVVADDVLKFRCDLCGRRDYMGGV